MNRVGFLLLWIAVPAAAENLLLNPGFEEVEGGNPVHWHLFVMPVEAAAAGAETGGAEGRLDSRVMLEGRYSVMLHNPKPYETEPANNWSQNILAGPDWASGLVGKELVVTGNIKTEQVAGTAGGEAALWLQCFRKDPWGVIRAASTSKMNPMRGTRDWTPVRMTVQVPEGTDFLVLRCVLKGAGTAWFDGISVETPSKSETESQASAKTGAKELVKPVKTERRATPTSEQPARAEKPEKPMPPMTVVPPGLETDIARSLLEAHQAMVETNQSLRDLNMVLLDRVLTLEQELDALRKQTNAPQSPSPLSRAPSASKEDNRMPPLVPRGFDLKTFGIKETP